jgi:hypothetical protein
MCHVQSKMLLCCGEVMQLLLTSFGGDTRTSSITVLPCVLECKSELLSPILFCVNGVIGCVSTVSKCGSEDNAIRH